MHMMMQRHNGQPEDKSLLHQSKMDRCILPRATSWTVFKTIHRAFVARVWTPWDQFTQGHLRCKRCSHTFPCGSCGCLTSLRQHFRCPNTKSYWRREFWTWEMDRNGACSVLTRVWNKILMRFNEFLWQRGLFGMSEWPYLDVYQLN